MIEIEYIYALEAEDKYFYVGRTADINSRFKQHQNDGYEDGTPKQRKIYQLQRDDIEFKIKILEAGTADRLQNKESLWLTNLRSEGHPLTNTRDGDSPLLKLEPAESIQPWTVELFVNADWKKTNRCKATEVSCWIKGYEFFRVGKTKLRFWHVDFGYWDIPGFRLNGYKAAIEKLTPGSKQWNDLISGVEQVKRLKG